MQELTKTILQNLNNNTDISRFIDISEILQKTLNHRWPGGYSPEGLIRLKEHLQEMQDSPYRLYDLRGDWQRVGPETSSKMIDFRDVIVEAAITQAGIEALREELKDERERKLIEDQMEMIKWQLTEGRDLMKDNLETAKATVDVSKSAVDVSRSSVKVSESARSVARAATIVSAVIGGVSIILSAVSLWKTITSPDLDSTNKTLDSGLRKIEQALQPAGKAQPNALPVVPVIIKDSGRK